VPVAERHQALSESLLESLPFRVDVDDRDMTVGKRVREAERRWIPYILVVGDREEESGNLTVRIHGGEQESRTIDELRGIIEKEVAGKPMRRLNVPVRLSQRPIFVG
jgi:threonyl-tRNA synthetase